MTLVSYTKKCSLNSTSNKYHGIAGPLDRPMKMTVQIPENRADRLSDNKQTTLLG